MGDPPPFPRWMMRADPILAAWESNGVFAAFHARRVRALGRRWPLRRACDALSGLGAAAALAGALALAIALMGLCAGPLALLALAIAWRLVARRMASPGRMPLYLDEWFRPRPDARGLAHLRQVPVAPTELGEAAVLERIHRDWPRMLLTYWLFIAAGLGIALATAGPPGLGDAFFAACAAWCGASWAPAAMLAQCNRLLHTVPESLAEVRDGTLSGVAAAAAAAFAAHSLYTPSLVLVVALESGFAYILFRAVAEVAMLYAAWALGFSPPGAGWSSEAAHALIGAFLLASTALVPRITATIRSDWQAFHSVASVDATRIMEELMEEEEAAPGN